MLVEKEVVRPGTYWYRDQDTGLPRKLVVTPELCKHWHDEGNKMVGFGLTVPVPYEHDFNAHPMTPKDKLLNNAGEVKQYTLKGDRLFSTVDVQDPDVRKKIGHSIRWTSPWINSFTDGQGREWKNVISHLALTTRPRIVEQEPFGSVAAALSMATEVKLDATAIVAPATGAGGFCLSRAGRLFLGKRTNRLRPRYPMAFSLWGGGIKLAGEDFPLAKKKKKEGPPAPTGAPGTADDKSAKPSAPESDDEDDFDGDLPDEEKSTSKEVPAPDTGGGATDPLVDSTSDVKMEELLCDLLQALGVPMPDSSDELQFKRHLYEAVMSKVRELTSKGMGAEGTSPNQNKPSTQQPNATQPQQNPLIQQEQQPMYMSLDEINKITDPTMKTIALSMYNENAELRKKLEAGEKTTNSLRDAKLKEEADKRAQRIGLLSKLSPKVKERLDALVKQPSMALSMGDGGAVIDPMAETLALLEAGFAEMPRLLTTDQAALSVASQPTDESMLTDARTDEIADMMARKMGYPPEAQAG